MMSTDGQALRRILSAAEGLQLSRQTKCPPKMKQRLSSALSASDRSGDQNKDLPNGLRNTF